MDVDQLPPPLDYAIPSCLSLLVICCYGCALQDILSVPFLLEGLGVSLVAQW